MNVALTNLSPKQLRQAANIKERIDSLQAELAELLGLSDGNGSSSAHSRRRSLSPAAIAKIRAAAKARWSRVKGGSSSGKPRRKMSAAAKAKLAAIARARWKKAKAEGRMAL